MEEREIIVFSTIAGNKITVEEAICETISKLMERGQNERQLKDVHFGLLNCLNSLTLNETLYQYV